MTYLKNVWLLAMSEVDEESSKVKLTWNENRTGFQYHRPGVLLVDIEIDQMRSMVHSLDDQLEKCAEKLFPPTMPLDRVMDLPWDTLQASTSEDTSFLDAKEPWEQWRQSAVSELTMAYQLVYGASITSFNKLLDLDKEFQGLLVGIIIANTGVPPRLSALREFAYRTFLQRKLNLAIRAGALTLSGGRQKMDSRNSGVHDFVLRAFSPRTATILTVYLGLCRQAIVEMMRNNIWHQDSVEAYNTCLFALYQQKTKRMPTKPHNGSWNMVHMISAWHNCSEGYLGAKLSIVDMRQLITGVYSELFPHLLYSPPVQSTAAVLQGDHTAATAETHYGRNNEQGNVPLSATAAHRFIQASRVWQALMQTVPLCPAWTEDILKSTSFDPDKKKVYALKVANHLIMPSFMPSSSTIEVKAILEHLFNTLPFILTTDVSAYYSTFVFLTDDLRCRERFS